MACWHLRAESTDETKPLLFRVTPGGWKTLGRSRGADFSVPSFMLSRLHCRVSADGDALEVEDLQSTNGTYVNGERVSTARLQNGDKLRVGDVELTATRAED